ncbi:MAG: hypothetical protein A2X94_02620 [Bdellovibrionales bacterium GWB1_55_8]|nr:MAG: hypothetical protein A2X94_02620 [Bdellovibrionales bacterium GWB1_55_8]
MLNSFALTFVALFVALDILGTLPLYIGMTHHLEPRVRNRVLNTSLLVALVVAIIFLFIGEAIFRAIGITVYDFKIGGGLVLLLISLADLVGQHEARERASGSSGIVPLAVPLITGPGVLTTLILQVRAAGLITTVSALLVNFLFAWVVLRHSGWIVRMIGKDGATVFSKIAALLLTAIAVAMIRSGIFEAIQAAGL